MKYIIPFLLILSACTKSGNNDNNSAIMPLGLNHSWTYSDSSITGLLFTPRTDTVSLTGYTTIGGKSVLLVNCTNQVLFGKIIYAISSDSNTIYIHSHDRDNGTLLFKKTSQLDTLLNNNGYYHISYPEPFSIAGYECYKNERIAADNSGKILSREVVYVSPSVGIIRLELYNLVTSTWVPNGAMERISAFTLTGYK